MKSTWEYAVLVFNMLYMLYLWNARVPESGMLKLLKKKKAWWMYENSMLKNGAAESGMLKKSSMLKLLRIKNGMLKEWKKAC